jgi:DNA-binding PucR family transcriptional regulator
LPIQSLVGIKRLINYSMKDLVDYLGFESQELLKTLGAP